MVLFRVPVANSCAVLRHVGGSQAKAAEHIGPVLPKRFPAKRVLHQEKPRPKCNLAESTLFCLLTPFCFYVVSTQFKLGSRGYV